MVSGMTTEGTTLTFQHHVSDSLLKATGTFKQLLSCPELGFLEFEQQVKSALWADQFGRLRIWAANIGAHQRGNTSLDFRLRDASHILNQIVELLDDLRDLLQAVLDLLRHVDEDENRSESLETDLFDDDDDSEYQELLSSVVLRIDCLFDMSVAVRKPAKLDRLIGINKAQWGPYSQYDFQHVQSKFPKSSRDLNEKLSAALTLRRGVLKYYETHRSKYASGINKIFQDAEAESHIEFSVAPATEYNGQDYDTRSISGQSNRSMGSLIAADRPLHIPVPSNLFDRKPFECPYCHYLLDTYNVRDFVRHVFDDITPYQCIFPGCLQSQNLIASRSAWVEHLHSLHKQQWLELSHVPCFMCGQPEYSENSFEKHVARHLEDLAIFALPVLDDEEDQDADEERQDSEDANSVETRSSPEPPGQTDVAIENMPEPEASVTRDESEQQEITPMLASVFSPIYTPDLDAPAAQTYITTQADRDKDQELERLRLEKDMAPAWNYSSLTRTDSQTGLTEQEERKNKEREEERRQILAEIKEKEDEAKKARQEERIHILAEAKEREEKERAEYEEMTERVLAAEKKEDEAKVGYARNYIENVLEKKPETRGKKARPTYIRVQVRHVLPETLDAYHLPWERDPDDDKYLFIKEYISHELQQALFQHTRRILKPGTTGSSREYTEDKPGKKESREKNIVASEAARPTCIRVQVRHVLPETLEYYHLPWEYDQTDDRYIMIKEYISHELQQEVFQHTKQILRQRTPASAPSAQESSTQYQHRKSSQP